MNVSADQLAQSPETTVHLFQNEDGVFAVPDGEQTHDGTWLATLPGLHSEWLGGRGFIRQHDVRFPYVVGAMANGIASARMVLACAQNGILAFFGSAGLSIERIAAEVDAIKAQAGELVFGVNLIHAPHEPHVESATAKLLIDRGVTHVSASAYMKLTAALVHTACAGLRAGGDGRVERARYIFAKISRPEVAEQFMKPAPAALLGKLVADGLLTNEEADLASRVPLSEDITVESDSGGHTDNQPLGALFPRICEVRDRLTQIHGYDRAIRIGAAGGIGSPRAVASAFALGADYVVTGSVNQAAVESGLSDRGRALLATCDFGDVMMAPAADMFEMGVRVQVLKRGTMFGVRGIKLWETYQRHDDWNGVPKETRDHIETHILARGFDDVWSDCETFFTERDPSQLQRAAKNPRHKMALVFRWYLGMSSRWAIDGIEDRVLDYQIWCGPAMASFNAWSKGSAFENPSARNVVDIAHHLMRGAAVVTRANQFKLLGLPVSAHAFAYVPTVKERLARTKHPA